jgi:signal transduction histidine kinase
VETNARSGPRRLRQRLNELLLGVPVFVKVMGIALSMAVVLGAGMLWQIHRVWHAQLVRELEQRGQGIASEVGNHVAELTRAGLAADVAAELRHSLAEASDVAYLILQDANGVVLAEARLTGHASVTPQIHELTAPFGHGPHRLRVGMSTARVDQEVGWLTRRLARTTAIITLLGMLGAWWLTRVFAHPIEELVAVTRAVKAGNYQIKTPVRAKDEVGELAAAFNEMTDAIAQKEAIRQQLLRQHFQATEEERKRIARELHDQTGQLLTSLIAGMSALETCAADQACRDTLVQLRALAAQALGELHDVSVALRPSALDDLGLVAALQKHCETFAQRFGLAVECEAIGLDGGERLPREIETALYRIVQEALTNAVRHGQARAVQVLLQRKDARMLTVIEDDGQGFDASNWRARCLAGDHLGLLGIEERAALLGGTLRLESKPKAGASLFVEIPLERVSPG